MDSQCTFAASRIIQLIFTTDLLTSLLNKSNPIYPLFLFLGLSQNPQKLTILDLSILPSIQEIKELNEIFPGKFDATLGEKLTHLRHGKTSVAITIEGAKGIGERHFILFGTLLNLEHHQILPIHIG